MKIGLSMSRCVADIFDGTVDIDDVLVVIARTDFDPRDDNQWANIWRGYRSYGGSNPEWRRYNNTDETAFRDIVLDLYTEGKLHQPRQFGAFPRRLPYVWLETVLPSTELGNNVAAKEAWDSFQVIAGLSNVKLDNPLV